MPPTPPSIPMGDPTPEPQPQKVWPEPPEFPLLPEINPANREPMTPETASELASQLDSMLEHGSLEMTRSGRTIIGENLTLDTTTAQSTDKPMTYLALLHHLKDGVHRQAATLHYDDKGKLSVSVNPEIFADSLDEISLSEDDPAKKVMSFWEEKAARLVVSEGTSVYSDSIGLEAQLDSAVVSAAIERIGANVDPTVERKIVMPIDENRRAYAHFVEISESSMEGIEGFNRINMFYVDSGKDGLALDIGVSFQGKISINLSFRNHGDEYANEATELKARVSIEILKWLESIAVQRERLS